MQLCNMKYWGLHFTQTIYSLNKEPEQADQLSLYGIYMTLQCDCLFKVKPT